VEKRSAQPQPGWTWANVDDLTRAATLLPASDRLTELRSEAATALGSIDLRLVGTVGEGIDAACLAFQPGGSLLALGPFKTAPLLDGAVQLIDLRQRDRERYLFFRPAMVWDPKCGLVQDGIWALAFSPDGRFLVGGTRSGCLHLWDLAREQSAPLSWQGHQKAILWLYFNPEGTALVSAAEDQRIKRWSYQEWDTHAGVPRCDRTWQSERPIVDLACHPTEGWLACFHSHDRLEVLSGETLQPLCDSRGFLGNCLQFGPDGNTLARSTDKGIDLMSPQGVWLVRTFSLPNGEINFSSGPLTHGLAFSPDGTLVLWFSTTDKHVKLWEMASGRQLAHLVIGGGVTRAGFSTDGRLLAVTAEKQTRLYEIGSLREQTFVASQSAPILSCALHPDGCSLACQSPSLFQDPMISRDVTVWPLALQPRAQPTSRHYSPKLTPVLSAQSSFHPSSQALAYTLGGNLFFQDCWRGTKTLSLEDRREAGLSFGPNGRLWWAVRDEVRVWDVTACKQVFNWNTGLQGQLSGLSNMYSVAAGHHWAAAGGRDGQVHLFHADNPARLTGKTVCQAPVRAVALKGDESLIAAGSDTGELKLVRVPDCTVTADGRPHQDRVEALSWSGDLLASGSRDRTVKLWHCRSGQLRELLTLRQPGPVRWLAFHPDGARLFVLLEREGAVRVWHLDRLFARMTAMGLGTDLGPIAPVSLPQAGISGLPEPVVEAPSSPNGLKAELFAALDCRNCVKVRYDAQVNWDWGLADPDPLLPVDSFSVRWTGWLKAPRPGRYTLLLESDDGSRLWLDGRRLIDRRTEGKSQVEVELTGKPQALRIEYFDLAENAHIRFRWAQQGGFPMQPVPTECLFHD
jgi:WD40 repeat protein